MILEFEGKSTYFKMLWDHLKNQLYFYTLTIKIKLGNNYVYNSIRKNKVPDLYTDTLKKKLLKIKKPNIWKKAYHFCGLDALTLSRWPHSSN